MAEDIAETEVPDTEDFVDHRDKLEQFRVDFVQTLDVERQFIFSYLRSKSVLDEEDCEIIVNAGAGRQQKVSKFLDVLARKGEEGYKHFVDSLEFEHPALYEKVTGKRASATRNSPMLAGAGGRWNISTGLVGKELVDYDRQYLANQLAKTAGDLQMLTYVHSKMVQEKNSLEERLLEATGDLESQQKHVEDLKEELRSITQTAVESRKLTVENLEPINRYMQDLIKENMDKSNAIITLQHRLLVSNEELDQTRRLMEELRKKNEALMQQFRDLTINYDWERRQSKRLTERVQRQTDEIRKSEDVRREIYELKFKLTEVREERDAANEQLQEFRRVTEALNMKFDLMVQEKEEAMEIHEEVSEKIFHLQEQVHTLEMNLKEANLELKDARRKNIRMSEEIGTYREQRASLLQEREASIQERNAALKERDEALRMNQELQRSRDEAVNKQISINQELESNYKTLLNELDETRRELDNMEANLKGAELKLQLKPSSYSTSSHSDSEVKDRRLQKSKKGKSKNPSADVDGEDADVDTDEESDRFNWKERSTLEVLNSAYNRVRELKSNTFPQKRASEPYIFGLNRPTAESLDISALNALRKVAAEAKRTTSPSKVPLIPMPNGSHPKRSSSGKSSPLLEIPKPAGQSVMKSDDDSGSLSRKSKPETERLESQGKSTSVNGNSSKIRRKSLPIAGEHPTLERKAASPGMMRSNSSGRADGGIGGILSSIIPAISDLSIGIAINRRFEVFNENSDTSSSPEKSPRGSPRATRKHSVKPGSPSSPSAQSASKSTLPQTPSPTPKRELPRTPSPVQSTPQRPPYNKMFSSQPNIDISKETSPRNGSPLPSPLSPSGLNVQYFNGDQPSSPMLLRPRTTSKPTDPALLKAQPNQSLGKFGEKGRSRSWSNLSEHDCTVSHRADV